jgi:hypothetical protein
MIDKPKSSTLLRLGEIEMISISPNPFQWYLLAFFAAMIVYYQKVNF